MSNGAAVIHQRRSSPRYGVTAQNIQINLTGRPPVTAQGLMNLGAGGMFIPVAAPGPALFAPGQAINVTWQFLGRLGAPVLAADCVVVHIVPGQGVGVKFSNPDPRLRRLISFLGGEREDLWPGPATRRHLDTWGVVIATLGVFCGLLGLYFIAAHRSWALVLMGAMLLSILVYAVLRFIRGPWRHPPRWWRRAPGVALQWP
jgi:hypothetical protein